MRFWGGALKRTCMNIWIKSLTVFACMVFAAFDLKANEGVYDSDGNRIGYVGSNGNGVIYDNDGNRIGKIGNNGNPRFDDGGDGRRSNNGKIIKE